MKQLSLASQSPDDETDFDAFEEPGKGKGSPRVVLWVSPGERELLEQLVNATGYPTYRAVIFNALSEMEASLGGAVRSAGFLETVESKVSRLEENFKVLRLDFLRFMQLVGAYQRSFQVFTILHDSKISEKKEGP